MIVVPVFVVCWGDYVYRWVYRGPTGATKEVVLIFHGCVGGLFLVVCGCVVNLRLYGLGRR